MSVTQMETCFQLDARFYDYIHAVYKTKTRPMFRTVIFIVFAPDFAKELIQRPPFNMEHGRKEAGGVRRNH